MFDLIGDPPFHSLMQGIFKGDYFHSPAAHARRVSPVAEHHFRGWQKPIGFHLDAQYHPPHQFGLNFWAPLNNCGEDAPGLRIILGRAESVIAEVGYDRRTNSFDPLKLGDINNHEFLSRIDEDRIFRPVMRGGDVLLFHNWTLHATYCAPGMKKVRKSFELRVNCRQFSMPE